MFLRSGGACEICACGTCVAQKKLCVYTTNPCECAGVRSVGVLGSCMQVLLRFDSGSLLLLCRLRGGGGV